MVCIANEENNKYRKEEKEPPLKKKKVLRENKITCGQAERIDFRIFDFGFKGEVIFQLFGRKQQYTRQRKVHSIFMRYKMA